VRGSRLAFVLPRILTPTSWLVLSAGGRLARTARWLLRHGWSSLASLSAGWCCSSDLQLFDVLRYL
jgi:hypothetical protein